MVVFTSRIPGAQDHEFDAEDGLPGRIRMDALFADPDVLDLPGAFDTAEPEF